MNEQQPKHKFCIYCEKLYYKKPEQSVQEFQKSIYCTRRCLNAERRDNQSALPAKSSMDNSLSQAFLMGKEI